MAARTTCTTRRSASSFVNMEKGASTSDVRAIMMLRETARLRRQAAAAQRRSRCTSGKNSRWPLVSELSSHRDSLSANERTTFVVGTTSRGQQ